MWELLCCWRCWSHNHRVAGMVSCCVEAWLGITIITFLTLTLLLLLLLLTPSPDTKWVHTQDCWQCSLNPSPFHTSHPHNWSLFYSNFLHLLPIQLSQKFCKSSIFDLKYYVLKVSPIHILISSIFSMAVFTVCLTCFLIFVADSSQEETMTMVNIADIIVIVIVIVIVMSWSLCL